MNHNVRVKSTKIEVEIDVRLISTCFTLMWKLLLHFTINNKNRYSHNLTVYFYPSSDIIDREEDGNVKKWKHILSAILLILSVAIGSIFIIGFIRYETLISEKPLDEVIAEIRSDPNYISLDDVNDDLINALLAVEDPTFYEHGGIVLSNIIEAVATNLREQDFVMGGSTITQQLSKNIYLDSKKTFQRKIAELFFVHDLESTYSKDEILEFYINVIYFGDGYYGINEAANGYFHKAPKNLTIAQATLLAGLPQAPAIYQLSDGMIFAKKRQQVVLEAMKEQKLITEQQLYEIYNQPV